MREHPSGNASENEPKNRVHKYDFLNLLIGHRIRMLQHEKDIFHSRVAKQINKSTNHLSNWK